MTTKFAAELEAFNAAAQRIGHTARAIKCSMVEAFATAGRAALASAYPWSGKPPAWLPLTWTCRPDTTIGRKRRARRARGRRIEARRWIRGRGHWVRVDLDLSRPSLLELARKIHVPVFDEIDRFPVMTDEQAQAYLDSHREQRRMITLEKGQAMGKSEDLVERLISPCDRIAFTCHLLPNGTSFEDVVAQQQEAQSDD
jgi:hypothetical protein